MKNFLEINKKEILFILLVITFFSFSIIITWDSTHYMTYVSIFEGVSKFSNWDIVRGPIFPYIIYLGVTLFGKTTQGILLLLFLFYLVFIKLVNYFCKAIFQDKVIIKCVVLLFCIFNPIIFGYFHTLLTEFVAITLAMCSCYFAYKWWNVSNKKKKSLYSLYFVIALPISWLLKRPYICCVLIPMIISIGIALFNNHTKQSVLYYLGTFTIATITLVISVIGWNQFLIYKGVDMNTGRDSSSMMSMQIIQGVQYYSYDDEFDFSKVDGNKYLSKKEKKFINENLNEEKNNLRIINIYNHSKLVEKDVIEVDENGIPSTKNVLLQLIKTFTKHPGIIVKNYVKNYCALSSICKISSDDGVMYSVVDGYDFINTFEHETIAYKNYNFNSSNSFYFPEERQSLVSNLIQTTNIGVFGYVENALEIFTNIVFKLTIILLPFALIGLILFRYIRRKRIINYNLYVIGLLLLSYAFFAVVANALSGALIDRYATAMFIPGLLGILAGIAFVILNIRSLSTKTDEDITIENKRENQKIKNKKITKGSKADNPKKVISNKKNISKNNNKKNK